ncbi:PREDICTED: protein TIFY 5A-like [Camelina sativa]|uniref:Protein TIFY n=1 Tax=Camelina sativa TaxID=90675 RepID=A0ABM0WZH1_CAMSA|nr:PREDICTED: protein TIFY 5A-like [Camelina sativa]
MKTMQQTCDLELRLFPSSTYDSDSSDDTSVIESSISRDQAQPKEESQRITIFYNGKMFVSSDVTHLQAKSIISMANRDMEEKSSSINGSDFPNKSTQFHHNHYQLPPNPKASMKRSLQNFLHKRKIRIQASSPYHHQHLRQ